MKNLNETYYMNAFLKLSETQENLAGNKEVLGPQSTKIVPTDDLVDGMDIVKSLILGKVLSKQTESNEKHFQTTFTPNIGSLKLGQKPMKKLRKKKCKVKSKVSWKNAETLIPGQFKAQSTKQIDSGKLFQGMMKEWHNDKVDHVKQVDSTQTADFAQSVELKHAKKMFKLPKRFTKKSKICVKSRDVKNSTFNSEKFILEMQKRKDSEKFEKLRSESLNRPCKKLGETSSSSICFDRSLRTEFLKPNCQPNRVKILTPICLNTSNSSALSVSAFRQ
jgi:hypothetical protein